MLLCARTLVASPSYTTRLVCWIPTLVNLLEWRMKLSMASQLCIPSIPRLDSLSLPLAKKSQPIMKKSHAPVPQKLEQHAIHCLHRYYYHDGLVLRNRAFLYNRILESPCCATSAITRKHWLENKLPIPFHSSIMVLCQSCSNEYATQRSVVDSSCPGIRFNSGLLTLFLELEGN